MTTDLPIESLRSAVIEAWQHGGCVISAPPGSGKTTRLPLWLIEQSKQPVYLLIPKRLPVVMAARQLAKQLNEQVGERVGYVLRGDQKRSTKTQLTVITYGSFLRQLLSDPDSLSGKTIILDEFHERSVDQDTTYALLNHYIEHFDDSVRRIIMSATLNIEQMVNQLKLPLIQSEGRSYPIDIQYQKTDLRYMDAIAPIIEKHCKANSDHVLVFLPGLAEIRRVERAISNKRNLLILHSQLIDSPNLQLLEDAPQTIILATNIAESSITIPRVRTVIDAGMERYSDTHPLTGLQELKTRRISRASAKQRAGRAGRLGPGRCIRLWSADEQATLVAHQPAEIIHANLTQTLLQCASWGARREDLTWLDQPAENRWLAGAEQLLYWQAIDQQYNLTDHGKKMANLGLEPWLAHLLATANNATHRLAMVYFIAHLITEKTLSYDPFVGDRSPKLEPIIRKEAKQLATRIQIKLSNSIPALPAKLLVKALADRIILWAADGDGRLISGTRVMTREPTKNGEWGLLLNAVRKNSRFLCDHWLPVNEQSVFDVVAPIETTHFDASSSNKPFVQHRRVGQILLSEQPAKPTQTEKQMAWMRYIHEKGEAAFYWNEAAQSLKERWKFIAKHKTDWPRWPIKSAWAELTEPFLSQCTRLSDAPLDQIILSSMGYPFTLELDQHVPTYWTAPSGRKIRIVYDSDNDKASVMLKLQEAFGLSKQPMLIDCLPITLELTAPNGRPVANVTDVSYFWNNVYPDVRKELRGRYAKHPWPEDPMQAEATQKTNRQLRTDPRH